MPDEEAQLATHEARHMHAATPDTLRRLYVNLIRHCPNTSALCMLAANFMAMVANYHNWVPPNARPAHHAPAETANHFTQQPAADSDYNLLLHRLSQLCREQGASTQGSLCRTTGVVGATLQRLFKLPVKDDSLADEGLQQLTSKFNKSSA